VIKDYGGSCTKTILAPAESIILEQRRVRGIVKSKYGIQLVKEPLGDFARGHFSRGAWTGVQREGVVGKKRSRGKEKGATIARKLFEIVTHQGSQEKPN